MKEAVHLNRAIFGGYKRQDVHEYIDDFYTEMESRYKNVSDTVNSLERENQILKQYINKSQNQESNVTEVMEAGKDADLLQLPEGIYQFDNKQAIRPLMTTKSLEAVEDQYSESAMPAGVEQESLQTEAIDHQLEEATMPDTKEIKEPLYENNGHYYTPNSAAVRATATELKEESEDKPGASSHEEPKSEQNIVTRAQFLTNYIQRELDDFTGEIELLHHENRQLTRENLQLTAKLEFANGLLKELYREGL